MSIVIVAARTSKRADVVNRLVRVLQILRVLEHGWPYDMVALAAEFEISRRTLFRDLENLRAAGWTIVFDRQAQLYYVHCQRERGQPPIDENRLAALALAAHLSPLSRIDGFAPAIRSAVSEVVNTFTEQTRKEVSCLLSSCRIVADFQGRGTIRQQVLTKVLRAIRQRQKVRLTLKRGKQMIFQTRQTKIAPYRLEATCERCWIIGQSSVHRKSHRFDLADVARVEILNESYTVPNGFSTKGRKARKIEPQPIFVYDPAGQGNS